MGGFITPQASKAIAMAARSAAFTHWFGFERRCAELLCVLVAAEGRPLTLPELALECAATEASIRLRVHLVRKAMEAEAIDRDESGYRLTEIGLAEVRAAMSAMAESLAVGGPSRAA